MARLTKEQQELVTDNHKLIYYTMYKYNLLAQLDEDECYGALAEGLCKAAATYDKRIKFSAYAVRCMLNEAFMLARAHKCATRTAYQTVSLYDPVDERGSDLLEELIADDFDFVQVYETSSVVREVVVNFAHDCFATDDERVIRDWQMLAMYLEGATVTEVAKAFGLSRASAYKGIVKLRRALEDRLIEQGVAPRPSTLQRRASNRARRAQWVQEAWEVKRQAQIEKKSDGSGK